MVFMLLMSCSAFILYIVFKKIYKHILSNRVQEIVKESVSFHYSRIE